MSWRAQLCRVAVERGVRLHLISESHQLHGDEDQQGSRCADGAHRQRSIIGTEPANGNAEYVFTNPDRGTRYTDVKKSFSAACREADITNFTFHDLRHTFGTRLADAGVDVVKIKELMGHASIVTTMRYIHATDHGKEWSDCRLVGVSTKATASLSQTKNGRPLDLP